MAKPLDGVKIVDLTSVVMGPYATQTLGSMGADVVKVEGPEGDPTRGIGPARSRGMGALFLNMNRNKRSIVLDLKEPRDRDALLTLCETADVLVSNIRPAAMERLGITYEAASARNPRLIFVNLVGFDQRGPYASRPAYDDLVQGLVGLPSLVAQAQGGDPAYVPLTIADHVAGLCAVSCISAALFHRTRTGKGEKLVVSMFEALAEVVLSSHQQGMSFEPPLGAAGYERLLTPQRRPYRTLDSHVCLLLYTTKHWRSFLHLVGKGELFSTDERFASMESRNAHISELYAFVAEEVAKRTTNEWIEMCSAHDIPSAPLNDLQQLMQDPHLRAIGFYREFEHPSEGRLVSATAPHAWSETPADPGRHAPRLGEHSAEVLSEIGQTAARDPVGMR